MRGLRALLRLTGACALAGLSGCTSGGSAALPASRVVVVEHDFGLTVSSASIPPGTVTLHIENRGPSTHELNVDETTAVANGLPLRPNGLQVDEESAQLHPVDSVSDVRVGTSRDLTVHLTPGHYVLFCNLEGHYLGGMHIALDVTS
jgi:uncharacterized cupredoxin-like copper-binding protein